MAHVNELKLVRIGNSKGIRIPKSILQKYGFSDSIQIEEKENGIMLHSSNVSKLSWEDTYKAMRSEDEDWSDFDNTLQDGLDD